MESGSLWTPWVLAVDRFCRETGKGAAVPRTERQLFPERSILDRFGYELRKWRKSCGLSLDRLGKAVHVSGDLLAKIEVAERRPTGQLAKRCDDVLNAG